MLLTILYLLIGSGLAHARIDDISYEVAMQDGDIWATVAVAFKWITTWPLWVGR